MMASLHALESSGLTKLWHLLKVVIWMIPFRWTVRKSVVKPKIFNFFRAVRANEAAHLPIGTAGFCWVGLILLQPNLDF